MIKRLNAFLILIFGIVEFAVAQSEYSFSVQLNWDGTKVIQVDDNVFKERLNFQGADHQASFNYHPNYFEMVELGANQSLESIDVIPLNESIIDENLTMSLDNNDFTTEYEYKVSEIIWKKKPHVIVHVLPIKKGGNGDLVQLDKFELVVNTRTTNIAQKVKKVYAEHSELSSGEWYKISVSETGVFMLTPDDFVSMGLNVSNPQNIRLFGYGGGMLPEVSGTLEYDDLEENAIYVHGEDDGRFDNGDYVLFYGMGQDTWTYNEDKDRFSHHENLYSEKTYYFINVDQGKGKRIQDRNSSNEQAAQTFTTFRDRQFHELNTKNIAKSGREWFGETFSSGSTGAFSFDFPNIDMQADVNVEIAVAASNAFSSKFDYKINNTSYKSSNISPKGHYIVAQLADDEYTIRPTSSTINLELEYNYSDAEGWLNYIEVEAQRQLTFSGSQMHFRIPESINAGVAEFKISNTENSYTIWDVSDRVNIVRQKSVFSNSVTEFKLAAEKLNEFVIFENGSFKSPTLEGSIENQDLHGLVQCDMVIATHKNFMESAEVLAEHHRMKDNLVVHVIELQKIYNEFSSGSQDISAIRNLMKMFYDRASGDSDLPKYLLLFGDGSYDNLSRIESNTNFVPTYQSYESLNKGHFSYVTDDFFGALDDGEGGTKGNKVLEGAVDIGVGRLPVQTTSEAEEVVNKILWYAADETLVNQATNYDGTVSNLADWRNVVCFVADNSDNNSYLRSSEELATLIDTSYQVYNIDKIYLDAYEKITTPGGSRYPGAKEALNHRFNKGALLINYIGHGGELGLAHERILEISDINAWTNRYNLPLFYTQTCELSRFDDPARESAGEMIFMKPYGGAISMITTTRPTYASSTMTMARVFFSHAFNPGKNEYKSIGELYMMAKASVADSDAYSNLVGMVLLGDPALKLAYPKYDVITTEINEKPVTLELDTVKALGKVTVSGYIENESYQQSTDFNGTIYPIVLDKRSIYTTLGQDGNTVYPFTLQNNIIYKGKVSVVNGEYSFSFVVPKDIAYQYGKGKISYYSENGQVDANGYTTEFIVGGSEENYEPDSEGPAIELFMNDTLFVSGGITNETPILLAHLFDEHGINTVGTGIGHDIKAVLDGNTSNPVILNSYYEADLDTYKSGKVKYKLDNISEGTHTLELTAWDIYNNSSSASIVFVVRGSDDVAMEKVKTFPNPFTENVLFEFEHNQAESDVIVSLEIYSALGKLVRKYEKKTSQYGYTMQNFQWDGKSESGLQVEDGVYFYTVKLIGSNGQEEEYTNKIIKMR